MSSIRITALDTWFFRESRPMDSIGGSELASVFPPSPRTVLGALRSAIGDAQGVDWSEFHAQKEGHPLYTHIGIGDDLGPLALKGLWINCVDKRLYPAPQFLLYKEEGNSLQLTRLRIGASVSTYLGQVRLPELPAGKQGYKTFDQTWITADGLNTLLAGETPGEEHIVRAARLFQEEARLGIARDNDSRTAMEGNLYQTRHLRPYAFFSLEMEIEHKPDTPMPTGLVRFGGEGRLAHLESCETPDPPDKPTPTENTRGLILILLSPARFEKKDQPSWLPTGFKQEEDSSTKNKIWTGSIAGVKLCIHASVIGKSQREGGWDMATNAPRPVESLVPAGSAYYVTLPDSADNGGLSNAIEKLHRTQIGEDQKLGRGLIACGLWNEKEYRTPEGDQE